MVVSPHYDKCTYNMQPGFDNLAHNWIMPGNSNWRFSHTPLHIIAVKKQVRH